MFKKFFLLAIIFSLGAIGLSKVFAAGSTGISFSVSPNSDTHLSSDANGNYVFTGSVTEYVTSPITANNCITAPTPSSPFTVTRRTITGDANWGNGLTLCGNGSFRIEVEFSAPGTTAAGVYNQTTDKAGPYTITVPSTTYTVEATLTAVNPHPSSNSGYVSAIDVSNNTAGNQLRYISDSTWSGSYMGAGANSPVPYFYTKGWGGNIKVGDFIFNGSSQIAKVTYMKQLASTGSDPACWVNSSTASSCASDNPSNIFEIDADQGTYYFGTTYSVKRLTEVPPGAPVVSLTSDATAISTTQTANLSWSATNTTACSGVGDPVSVGSATNLSGAYTFTSSTPGSYSFTQSCTGPGGRGYSPTLNINVISTPTCSSPTITNIAPTSVTVGGNITSNGGSSLTGRGVAFGTSTDPTSLGNTLLGDTLGAFTVDKINLKPGTTYYYRAWGQNSAGTGFCPSSSFTTPSGSLTTDKTSCSIPDGSNTCSVQATWTTSGVTSAAIVNDNTGAIITTALQSPSGGVGYSIPYGTTKYILKDNDVTPPYPLSSVTLTATCSNSWDPVAGKCYKPLSDLTAGAITPTTAKPGVAQTYSGTITNIGNASSDAFYYTFQFGPDGVTSTSSTNDFYSNALSAGSSTTRTISKTFTTQGYQYMRLCADTYLPRITESNENNNCGPWTKITISNAASFTATAVSDSQIDLSWNVGRSTLSRGGTTIGTFDSSYSDKGLACGTTYSYSILVNDATSPYNGSTFTASATTAPCYPDLTAGPLSPTVAAPNIAQTFSATITNNGNIKADTTSYLFQYDNDTDHTSGIVETSTTANIISAKGTKVVSLAHTFTTSGTKYGRVCADKSSAADQYGDVDEGPNHIGENNNCGEWTMITVGEGPMFTATTISPTQINLSWNVGNSTLYRGGTPIGTFNSSYSDTGLTCGTTYGYRITVSDSSSLYNGNYYTTSATTGACVGAPTLTLNAPASVSSGSNADLSWTSTNTTGSCTASGDWSGSKVLSGSQQVGPLTAKKNYTLTCSNSAGTTVSKTATVDVTSTTGAMSGVLTPAASVCYILVGQSSCDMNFNWDTTNPEGISEIITSI